MREVGAELLCIEQLKALALDLVRALRRITEAHVWLIALIRRLLHNKARGGLKSKSPHVAGPNLADMSLTRSDLLSLLHALRNSDRYVVALAPKANLVDGSLRDIQAMAGCVVDDDIEIHRGRQRRTIKSRKSRIILRVTCGKE
jgi:hypothetical protein